MKRLSGTFFVVLSAALLAGMLSGCQSGRPDKPSGGGFTVTDMAGREVSFEQAPKTIAALQASDVEVLYAIDAGDMVVGVGEYCNYPAEAQEKTVLTSGANTNIEQIISLAPDVLIIGEMAQTKEQVEQLEKAGVKVVLTNAQDIEGAYQAIELVGKVSGHEEQAATVVSDMKEGFEQIKAQAGDGQAKVYFEVSPLEYGLWAAGSNTFMQELCDMVGAENIFADVEGWQEVSEEQVIARNPDVIITVAMYLGEGPTPEEEILSRTGWQEISAVKNGRVYQADNDQLTRPGPRLVEAGQALHGLVHGQGIPAA